MKKTRLFILGALSALALTSCSLFNDNDINLKIENHFNSKEEASAPPAPVETVKGVGSQELKIEDTNARVFKSIVYSNTEDGKIKNTYTTANGCMFNTNNGQDYEVSKTNNNFDLYLPVNDSFDRTADQTIVLFIHGGAWVSGLKTHVNPYVKEFTKRGYASATIEYSLLSKAALTEDEMDDATLAKNRTLSLFRDLDEIDACIYTMKSCLVDLGFTGNLRLVIGGVSSGAHLTMLYAYSRLDTCPMPIRFLINAVGPTDINESVWKAFVDDSDAVLDGGITYSAISSQPSNLKPLGVSGASFEWNEYQTMRIANGMCGFPYSPTEVAATADGSKVNVADKISAVYKNIVSNTPSGEKLLSVTNYISAGNKIPMLCGYAGKDTIVGIGQFANLQHALENSGYVEHTDYEYFYFKECGHTNLDNDAEQYSNFINKITNWLETK